MRPRIQHPGWTGSDPQPQAMRSDPLLPTSQRKRPLSATVYPPRDTRLAHTLAALLLCSAIAIAPPSAAAQTDAAAQTNAAAQTGTAAQTTAATQTTPTPPRSYLELQQRYSLADTGVDLDLALGNNGEVYLSSASQGQLWRLDHDRLRPFAAARACAATDGGGRPWPSTIAADRSNRLWVIDQQARRVQALDANGRSLGCHSLASLLPATAAPPQYPSDARFLLRFPAAARLPLAQQLPAHSSSCIEAGSDPQQAAAPDLYCISADHKQLRRFHHHQPVAVFTLPGEYPHAAGLGLGDDGALYLSDRAGARLYRLSPSLELQYPLPLYTSLLRSPTRLRIANGELWLIDEGRQQLLRFALRRADTPLQHHLLGEELLSLGLYADALSELQRGGAPDPLLIGQALYGLKRYPAALAQFSQAARRPGDANSANNTTTASFWRGNALFRLGRLDAALSAYQHAAQGHGEIAQAAAFNRAQTLLAARRYKAAARAFEQLLRQHPQRPRLRLGSARAVLGSAGGRADRRSAITQLTALLDQPTVQRQARYYLGQAWLAAGNPQRALPLLQRAAQDGPRYHDALTALLHAQQALGQRHQAEQTRALLAALPQRVAALNDFIIEEQQP